MESTKLGLILQSSVLIACNYVKTYQAKGRDNYNSSWSEHFCYDSSTEQDNIAETFDFYSAYIYLFCTFLCCWVAKNRKQGI